VPQSSSSYETTTTGLQRNYGNYIKWFRGGRFDVREVGDDNEEKKMLPALASAAPLVALATASPQFPVNFV